MATVFVVLGGTAVARAEMCSYSVASASGLCPAAAGDTVCLPSGAPGAMCAEPLRCLGVGPLCFDFTLVPQGGPAVCPHGSALGTNLKCTPLIAHRALGHHADRSAPRPPS